MRTKFDSLAVKPAPPPPPPNAGANSRMAELENRVAELERQIAKATDPHYLRRLTGAAP